MEKRADLHIHSTCSDGTCTPEEILLLAKQIGLFGLSITDHDSIDAYTPTFLSRAQELEIEILPGIEVSSEFSYENHHILGYGFDLSYEPFITFVKKIQKYRHDRNEQIFDKLDQKGIKIDRNSLYEKSHPHVVGRAHIAMKLVEMGIVPTFQKAFDLYLKQDACCYATGKRYSSKEVIESIHSAKGKAVLAHPHLIKRKTALALLQLPFDGIEVYYAKFPLSQEKPWEKLAEKKGLLKTGGSDFHGTIKPLNSLGCSWVLKDIFDKLRGE